VVNATKKTPNMSKSLQSSLKRARYELMWYNERGSQIFESLEKNNSQSDYRLPTFAVPETYDIYLRPHFQERNFTFEGNVTIDISIQVDTFKIVLHKEGLNIKKIYVVDKSYEILSHKYNETTNMLSIYFGKLLTAGTKLQLTFKFTGQLKDDMKGFYKSYYIDDKGNTK
jgi:aminopeptidase N